MNNPPTNIPADFAGSTAALMGEELYGTYTDALAQEPPVSIRLNPLKGGDRFDVPSATAAVPWCREGVYLGNRPTFTADPLMHAGCYYVQEASSMFVAHVLRQLVASPVAMLDLCAAPGGKSTAARSVLPEGSVLFANEPMRTRANILNENITKYGHPDVVVTNNYPRDYKKARIMFDVILADVPCSGEGMFRKDSGAVADWSRAKVAECSSLQRDIVSDIWPCLKPGGLLIYSTCTYNTDEDEDNAAWIAQNLGADFVTVDTQTAWGITPQLKGDNPCYRFIPGRTRGEGLFMTILRKHGHSDSSVGHPQKPAKKRSGKSGKDGNKAVGFVGRLPLMHPDRYALVQHGDTCYAVDRRWETMAQTAAACLNIMGMGIAVCTQRGKSMLPVQGLALSAELDRTAYPEAELSQAEAIAYLRREAIRLPQDAPTGFVLVTYDGMPLGFVKNIGNRCNNLYPAEWRIKSSHMDGQEAGVLRRRTARERETSARHQQDNNKTTT